MDNKLEIFLTEEGYTDLKEVIWKDEVLVCGLRRFIFTTGLVQSALIIVGGAVKFTPLILEII